MAVTSTIQTLPRRPRVAVTLGDAAGVGPELIAKLLSNSANLEKADVYIMADRSELAHAIADAGHVYVPVAGEAGPEGARVLDDGSAPDVRSVRSEVTKEGGARCLYQLRRALKMQQAGEIDAILFAPLNKSSLKKAGMTQEDELRWFADELNFSGTTSEINIAGSLWTGRVTSHISIGEVAERITKERTLKAIELVHRLRWESGIENPRLAVCALNPHNGENGAFGRQEIDAIRPAVQAAREQGINAEGPFPCDTVFLKRESYDAFVTMYHDQGQIALKLLAFDGGVTVQGGLPIPIATPAHGTAFDIAGKNMASVVSTQNAFDIAVTMARRRIEKEAKGQAVSAAARVYDLKPLPQVVTTELRTCC
ncbi:hypothetical protein E8E13_008274 [Curvularia kusanoi]|uniref:4-hydroxythreonine-4-phosphate dehydrogenase n=1 Tax=Curvularia kusanoi TaxID=90978 RepID=A0A9P4TEZ9_CURKU|nr:hypothetical protein E8E13_008274 [Curvularia kusanoi]